MFKISRFKKRIRGLAIGFAASAMVIGNVASVAALSSASVTMSDPRPSETGVTYTVDASGYDAGTTIQCIQTLFTVNADGSGGTPAGMSTTGAALDASGTLITEASWTEDFATDGLLEITFNPGETPAANGTLVFTGVTNPNTDDTFFATLTTYTDDACTTPVDTVVIAFATKTGTQVSLTIDPNLTFTVSGVAASTAVSGTNTTHASTASSIDYLNDVTASQNGVSAHNLDVTTNASGGYTVYIRHTGSLTNSNSDTIDNHTGTNSAPTSFPAVGTEAWGYATSDSSLSAVGDGADRFTNPGGEWAGFTTTNEEVMTDEAGTTTVAHQVGVASSTEAGTYTTNIVYTVVASF